MKQNLSPACKTVLAAIPATGISSGDLIKLVAPSFPLSGHASVDAIFAAVGKLIDLGLVKRSALTLSSYGGSWYEKIEG